MTEASDRPNQVFVERCRPRQLGEVCILAFEDDCWTDGLSWLSAGIDSRVRAGCWGFVFELAQFNKHRPLEEGLGHIVRLMSVVARECGGHLNWLHGGRFVAEWKRLRLMGVPPENFETEGEAVEALRTVFKAQGIRKVLVQRLTSSGVSLERIANAAGLFEHDVRLIAAGQQQPSDAIAILISSVLDSLTTESVPDRADGPA